MVQLLPCRVPKSKNWPRAKNVLSTIIKIAPFSDTLTNRQRMGKHWLFFACRRKTVGVLLRKRLRFFRFQRSSRCCFRYMSHVAYSRISMLNIWPYTNFCEKILWNLFEIVWVVGTCVVAYSCYQCLFSQTRLLIATPTNLRRERVCTKAKISSYESVHGSVALSHSVQIDVSRSRSRSVTLADWCGFWRTRLYELLWVQCMWLHSQ